MSKYDFYKRLKRMLDNDCEIVQLEGTIARKSTKYYEAVASLKTTLGQQEHELKKLRQQIDELQRGNEQFANFIHNEEERIKVKQQNTEKLQKEYEKAQQELGAQRKVFLLKMGFVRKIKETTQTYFNMDPLPHRLKGVSVQKTNSTNDWTPFDIDVKDWIQSLEEHAAKQLDEPSKQGDEDMDKENVVSNII